MCLPSPSQAPPKILPADWIDGLFPDYDTEPVMMYANE